MKMECAKKNLGLYSMMEVWKFIQFKDPYLKEIQSSLWLILLISKEPFITVLMMTNSQDVWSKMCLSMFLDSRSVEMFQCHACVCSLSFFIR